MKKVLRPKWTTADRARHKAIRKEFAHCPAQEELTEIGDYEGRFTLGAYFTARILVAELKKIRQCARLTLAVVANRAGMDKATLIRLENGKQPNPTVDTLWRYADAVGRKLVLSHAGAPAAERHHSKRPRIPVAKSGQSPDRRAIDPHRGQR